MDYPARHGHFLTGDEDKGLGTGETRTLRALCYTTTMDVLHWAADELHDGWRRFRPVNERDDLTAGSLSLIWDLMSASVLAVQSGVTLWTRQTITFRGHAGLP